MVWEKKTISKIKLICFGVSTGSSKIKLILQKIPN